MPRSKPSERIVARRYLVRGRVQGVGYRYFAQRMATEVGVIGYARNLEDGRVEVYAAGTLAQLADLAGYLRQGPRWADVRGVDESETQVLKYSGFQIERY